MWHNSMVLSVIILAVVCWNRFSMTRVDNSSSALQSSLPAADDPSVGPTTSAPPSRATIHSIASSSCDNDREPDRTTTDDALIPAPSSCYTAKLEESMNKDETKDNASMKFTPKPPPEPKPKSAGTKWLLLLRVNPCHAETRIFQAI